MRRIAMWAAFTVIALVLLFGYRTSTLGQGGTDSATTVAPAGIVAESPVAVLPSPTAAAEVPAAPSPAAVVPSPSPSPATAKATTSTVNGVAVNTRYGPVQVQIKVSGNRIVSADAIVYPTNERRDREINDYAVPQLDDETVQAQSANIDTVSGATYTSDGYRESLQSAIDAAHLS